MNRIPTEVAVHDVRDRAYFVDGGTGIGIVVKLKYRAPKPSLVKFCAMLDAFGIE